MCEKKNPAALLHPRRRSDGVAAGPRAHSVYGGDGGGGDHSASSSFASSSLDEAASESVRGSQPSPNQKEIPR